MTQEELSAFSVTIKDEEKTYEESIEGVNLDITWTQLKPQLKPEYKLLLDSLLDKELSATELQLGPQLGLSFGKLSARLFKKEVLYPALDLKLITQTHPESPRHPRQKYYLTELGKAVQQRLKAEEK